MSQMSKLFLLLVAITGNIHAVPWSSLAKQGSTLMGINSWGFIKEGAQYWSEKLHYAQLFDKNGVLPYKVPYTCLNDNQEYQDGLNKTLNTYAPLNSAIKIYQAPGYAPVATHAMPYYNALVVEQWVGNALKEKNKDYLVAQGLLGREIGRVVHNDSQRKLIALPTIMGLTSLSSYVALRLLPKHFLISVGLAGAKAVVDTKCFDIYQKVIDKQADKYCVAHTDNPAVLSALAQHYHHLFLNSPVSTFNATSGKTDLKRAAYFAKAAEDLEKKQK